MSINWSATDAGSGIASGPTPATDSQNGNTSGQTKTATATDRLGNVGNGSVTIKLDKMNPSITGSRLPIANSFGWNNSDVTVSFICDDGLSGIKTCTGATTLTGNGAGQSVNGTAVDNADNSASATVSGINIDKAPPTLSGAPTTSPNGAGWYRGDVTIAWTCADALSGINGPCPANSTISGEGEGLTANASVQDKAGNQTTATSSPAIKIDRTAPTTTASAPPVWNNVDVTVDLNAFDSLSGISATYYRLNGGAQQAGTSVQISSEGVHTLEYWSVDRAGNVEGIKDVQVKIDLTTPTITHTQSPNANSNGWNNSNVTVTFICEDSLSGIASCTSPQTVTVEGQSQEVIGTAVDNAGNTATDPTTVSIDKTPPGISAAADRAANQQGWYNNNVIVSFACSDGLSGIDTCSTSQTLGEGANQSASGTATDAAGNSASADLSGINVDKTAPTLSGAPSHTGWVNHDVTVAWDCSDSLSGIIPGTCPAASTVTGEGHNLSASAEVSDRAGNTTNTTVSGIKIDRSAPSTAATVPTALASGWYAGSVQVTLTGVDFLSGIATTYYRVDGGAAQVYNGPFLHSLGGEHTITFWSMDNAGNVEDAAAAGNSVTLKIDNVQPTITGSRTPEANGYGWNNGPVMVSFSCADTESGIASCSTPTARNDEGANQSVTGTAEDSAGNTATTTVSGINIDLTAPTVAITGVANGGTYTLGAVPAAGCSTSDALSGVETHASLSTSGGPINSVTATCNGAMDKAGNTSGPASATYSVIYVSSGTCNGAPGHAILQPVNADGSSVFKKNSTVPLKFRVCNAAGQSIGTPGVVTGFTVVSAGGGVGTVNETVSSATPDTAFRWDASAQQWLFNLKTSDMTIGTKTATINLDDGTAITFTFGVR